MSVVGQLIASDVITTGPFADRYYAGNARVIDDVEVSDYSAMGLPAFYACMVAICEDVAKVPFGVYQDLGDKGRKSATNHPVHDLIHRMPNVNQTSLEWREMIQAFAILRGYGVSELRPGPRGPVDQIVPLHPDLVTEKRTTSGELVYDYQDPLRGYQVRRLMSDEVHVLRWRFGRSVIDFMRSQVVLDYALETQTRQTFSRGARFQGVLQHPKTLSPAARTNLRTSLNEYSVNGPKSGRPMLLEEGMTWQSVSLTNKDAEFLATRQFSLAQWERGFRIPAHKIQDLTRSTNNNIEQQSIDYVTDSLLGPTVRWESSCNRDLLSAHQYFTKLTLDMLMRGDTKSRYEAYGLGINAGWLTRNEVRTKEDMNPLDGLDEPLSPLNMGSGSSSANPAAVAGYLRLFASDAASRVVRRETAAIGKLAERTASDPRGYAAGVAEFYDGHASHVAQTLHIPEHVARGYARDQARSLLAGGATTDWQTDVVGRLTDLAIQANYPQETAA